VIILEKFFSLPLEKQHTIIDAALSTFGTNGYKKTSISDIAVAAEISKAMVFHYFGTKKSLYLYLIELCGSTFINAVNEKFDKSVTDFFDRIMLATDIEISMMKKHPAILAFLNSAYNETDFEVRADLRALFTNGEEKNLRKEILDGMDSSKFKDGVDPKLVMKMLTWFGYGYMYMSPEKTETDLDALYNDFKDCIRLLKNNLYKTEYL
jgi:AcrR family transcriptional regulator